MADPIMVDCLMATQEDQQIAAVLGELFEPSELDSRGPGPNVDTERLEFLRPYASDADMAPSPQQHAASMARLLHAFDVADGLSCCDDRDDVMTTHNLLAIDLYTAAKGEPEGLDRWLTDAGRVRDDDAVLDWYIDIGNGGIDPYDDIKALATQLDQQRESAG